MRSLAVLSANFYLVYSKLKSTCDNAGTDLVINIPYEDEASATILYFNSGTCVEWGNETTGFYKGYNDEDKTVDLIIPIEHCNLRTNLYDTSVLTRTSEYYRPTANITFGITTDDGKDLIFREMLIAAECIDSQKEFTVKFSYDDIKPADKEEFTV